MSGNDLNNVSTAGFLLGGPVVGVVVDAYGLAPVQASIAGAGRGTLKLTAALGLLEQIRLPSGIAGRLLADRKLSVVEMAEDGTPVRVTNLEVKRETLACSQLTGEAAQRPGPIWLRQANDSGLKVKSLTNRRSTSSSPCTSAVTSLACPSASSAM